MGVETILHIRSGSQTLLGVVAGMAHHRVGETIRFGIVREHLHYFDADGARIQG
jgi:ABC-type sugar transport system ATPase subunit